ncbi:SMP-30/gluconolactonase/LRE family protein [Prescottella equi]|uniref:SMP-30/gluconolactonase/LRE family protein n=1 Tax=Rhodococcus hoagii TaxID=43767 RepID=UPI00301D9E7C
MTVDKAATGHGSLKVERYVSPQLSGRIRRTKRSPTATGCENSRQEPPLRPSCARTNPTFLARQDGKLWDLDTATGELSPPTSFAGNGLLRLPDNDLLTTWVGTEGYPSKGLSRHLHDSDVVAPIWSTVPRSEGLTLSADGRAVYTDDLFTGQIIRVPLDSPDQWTVVATLPGALPGPDDLTASQDGALYVAAHLEGAVYRVDPDTGAACAIATGLSGGWTGPSSVRIGPHGEGWALYATAFDGTLRRLIPPARVDLAPARGH